VPAEQLGRLAERGFRTDAARSRAPGGQGLGLSIAREVARRHHFTFDLQSPPEGGLTVVLEGACAPAAPPAAPPAIV
jgi:signal transduction histidine kinase